MTHKTNNQPNSPTAANRAAQVSRKVARRGARETRKAIRRFGALMIDTLKALLGVGQRRLNRRNNRTTIGRFINDIITLAETSHLTGLRVNLSEILIEPRFLAATDIIEPVAEDDVLQEVYYVVPRIPDLPQIAAPYNMPAFSIPQLAVGHRRLAILGPTGSGRTTALMAIALWAVREIEFEEPNDPVKQRLELEVQQLTEKERKKLEREKQERIEAARAQLEIDLASGQVAKSKAVTQAEAHQQEQDAEEDPLPPFTSLVPLVVHLADLHVSNSMLGAEVDPAEPLVRALQRSVSSLTARTIPRMIYRRLEENSALILLDGYDELPPTQQKRVQAWLKAFIAQYGKNFIIMTGPDIGYGPLMKMGITPLFVKPWNHNEINTFIEKWVEAWPDANRLRRNKPGPAVGASQRKRAEVDNYGLTPAELTFKVWAMFSDDTVGYHPSDWIEPFIKTYPPNPIDYDATLPLLQNAGALQTDLGFITLSGIEVLNQQSAAGAISQNALAQLNPNDDGLADDDTAAEEDAEDAAAIERARLLRALSFAGLMTSYRGGRYRFRHSLMADHYASLTLHPLPQSDPASLFEIAQKPNWQRPLRFAAAHTQLDDVVRMKLMTHPDLLQSSLIEMTRWLAYTREAPEWRGEILRRLGNAFVHPGQFVTARERLAAALVASRDPDGALSVFEYGLRSEDIDVRRLSCLGIGAMGVHGRRLTDQVAALIEDPEQDVQVSAAHALVAMGTEIAKQTLTQALLEGEERLQQAVAEGFALMPEDGYATLYEAVEHEEMFVRRSALFGLRRVETEWARDLVHERFLNEKEWFVRVVAQEGFLKQEAGLVGPTPPPNAEDVFWIQRWADNRGVAMKAGHKSNEVLQKALADNNLEIRTISTVALGQLGAAEAARLLYVRLADPEPVIQEAAHKALVELQTQIGDTLPDPR